MRHNHQIRIARNLACIALAGLMLVSCVADPNTVRPDAVVRDLPISPEGRWHDLQALAARPNTRSESVVNLFSLPALIVELGDVPSIRAIPTEVEPYREALDTLKRQYEALETLHPGSVDAFARSVLRTIAAWRRSGTFFTSAPEVSIKYRNANSYPFGPNRATLHVTFTPYPHLRKQIETQTFSISFVQEYEFWKIVALDPALLSPPVLTDDDSTTK